MVSQMPGFQSGASGIFILNIKPFGWVLHLILSIIRDEPNPQRMFQSAFFKKRGFPFLAFLAAFCSNTAAQQAIIAIEPTLIQQNKIYKITFEAPAPFIAYALTWSGGKDQLWIRFSEDSKNWEDWTAVEKDEHIEQSPDKQVSQLYFTAKEHRYFQLQAASLFTNLFVHFYNPGESLPAASKEEFALDASCTCAQPPHQKRSTWCPAGNCPPSNNPVFTDVSHLIIHHSAGTNSASDWAAVVRAIWNFHVNVNGWADIGYNWLVDPNGVIYEGRGDDVLGAHFCGTNTNTMGTCVLGDFTATQPSAAALQSLTTLLAWKACKEDIDPQGISLHASSNLQLHHVSGHRDGCATSCPGDLFYPLLATVRQSIVDYTFSKCSNTTSIAGASSLQHIRLFPNPSGAQLQLEMNNHWLGNIQLVVSGISGNIIQTLDVEKSSNDWHTVLSLASLPPGFYVMTVRHAHANATLKFVKQ